MSKSTVPSAVQAELNRQLNHELGAAYAYLALSAWCSTRNLKGSSAFFTRQAAEERAHADKFIKHLIDRGAVPEFTVLAAPKQDFESLLSVALHAQAMEQANTRGIHAAFEAALAAKDYPAQVLLHWFINEQVEEEAWAGELVARVQSSSCAGSALALDRHIFKLLADDDGDKA